MVNFILFLDRLINFYLYYVVMACFLSLVPNINPAYPLFDFIFKSAGFYLIPPVFGFIISPVLMMILLTLVSIGVRKLYFKYFAPKEQKPNVIIMTPQEFMQAVNEGKIQNLKNNENNNEQIEERKDKEE